MIILITATILATAGLSAQADMLSQKAVPDMNAKDIGPIAQSIYCTN